MKKIFFVNSTLSLGGAEKMVYEVITHLDKAMFSVKVCCLYGPGAIARALMAQGVDIEHSFMKNKYDLLGLYRLLRLVKKERIDLLYLESSPLTLFWGFLFARIAGVSRIVTVIHGMRPPMRWIRFKSEMISRFILPRLDAIGVVSRIKRDSLIKEYGLDPKKVELIHNGIDIDRFNGLKDKDKLREKIGISKDEKIVGMVGRLVTEKAYDVFLKSARMIAGRIRNSKFVIIGDGKERQNLERLSITLGLKEQVIFLGERHDAADLVSLFDIAVLSSRVESFPLTLLEYMAARRPIVTTDAGGTSEIILDRETGLVVPSENPELLSGAIMELLRNPEKAGIMGATARKRVEEKFSLPLLISKMERFFLNGAFTRQASRIVMTGPSLYSKGGISSFAKNYLGSELAREFSIIYHPTTIDSNVILKSFFFIKSLMLFFVRLLVDRKVRIVHVCSASGGSFYRKAIVALLSKFFKRPVVFHIHGAGFDMFYENSHGIRRFCIRKILDICDTIVVLSKSWHSAVSRMTKNTNIIIISNPIDVSDFKSLRSGRDFSKPNVFTAGRLEKRKGTYDILDIVPAVVGKIPDARFYFAGDGDVEKVRKICSQRGLENNVFILGWLDKLKLIEAFRSCAVFLLPSYQEGFPVSILEAMASGMPVVSTRVGGIPEMIEEGVNGFLVEPGQRQELAQALIDLLKDERLRERMGRANIEKVDSLFRIERVLNRFYLEYEKLLERRVCHD